MKYAFFAFVSTLFVLAAWVLSPFLAGLSMAFKLKRLPLGLQWFSTVDDDLDGGQHQNHYTKGATGFALWWQRTCWICRNPAQGFQAYLLGYSATNFAQVVDERRADGGRYREWLDFKGGVIYADQRNIRINSKYYVKQWFGWALKANMNRFTFKFVPFSIGVYK